MPVLDQMGQAITKLAAPPPTVPPTQTVGTASPSPDDYPQLGVNLGKIYDEDHPLWSNPDHRIELRWHQANTQAQATDMEVKRAIDANNLPTILADKQKEKEHHDHLFEEIAKNQAAMDQPLPIHKGLGLDLGEELAAGLGMIFSKGRDRGQILADTQANHQQQADLEYQQQMTQRQHHDQNLQHQQAFLQQEAESSQRRMDSLDTYQLQEADRLNGEKHTDLTNAKNRFANAKNKGEVLASAKDIEELSGQALPPQAISEALSASGLAEEREARSDRTEKYNEALRTYQSIQRQVEDYGGAGTPEQMAIAQAQVDSVNKGGYNFPALRGGPTEKAKNDAALQAFQKQKETDMVARVTREYNIRDKQVTGELANWESEREFRKSEVGHWSDMTSIARLRAANGNALIKAQQSAQRIKMDLDQANEDIKNFKGDPGEPPKTVRQRKSAMFAKRDALKSKLEDANNGVSIITKAAAQDDKDPLGSDPSDTPSSGGFSDGQTKQVNGHTYRRDGGVWHLVQ